MFAGMPSDERTAEAQITKIDEDKRLVFGWASIIKDAEGRVLLDRQNDFIDDESELEQAAYLYALNSRDGGEMHIRKGVSTMVESVVFTKEKQEALGIPEGTMPVGWWIGFRVNDDRVWDEVKKGNYSGFSVHGTGQRRQEVLADGSFTEVEKATCPTATASVEVNKRNRALAVERANYGPASGPERCGNCRAYDQSSAMMKCIGDGRVAPASAVAKREVGFCKSLDFMCSSRNTCDGWVAGGPVTKVKKRQFTAEQRRQLADQGKALPDGSYPIVTRADLRNAIQAIGRATNRAQVTEHIRRRAKALNAEDMLPGWAMEKNMDTVPVSKALVELLTKAQKRKKSKIATVMREFKAGKLKSSTGEVVTDPKQAMAIAISEQKRMAKEEKPGHPFRGNQYTGGVGSRLNKNR